MWKASKAKENCLASRVLACRIVFVIGKGDIYLCVPGYTGMVGVGDLVFVAGECEHIPVCTWLHRGG